MIGRNIKKYRLLVGLSLREMANKLGVSHQTIKKYEDDIITPTSSRLIEIADVLNVDISELVSVYEIPKLKFNTFRKKNSMTKSKQEGLFLLIEDEVGKYLEILDLANEKSEIEKDKWSYKVNDFEDIETISLKVRKKLNVSKYEPLFDLTGKLEDNNFLIMNIDYDQDFDGFSEVIGNKAFIVLSSKGYERNRFTLAHELGHIVLDLDNELSKKDIENYCNFFVSCLYMPKEAMLSEFKFDDNSDPNNISLFELFVLAEKYGVSLNAVIMRLANLNIISQKKKEKLFKELSVNKLTNKQLKFINEEPTRRTKLILKLDNLKVISKSQTVMYLGTTINDYFNSKYCN